MYRIGIFLFTFLTCFAEGILSNEQIESIFDKFVKVNYTEEYSSRYDKIPFNRLKNPKFWIGKDAPRLFAILEFSKFIKKNRLSFEKTLSFCSHDPEFDYFKTKEVNHFNYSDDPHNYDLHQLNIPGEDYDFVMLNQTLEHLYNPLLCLKNIYKKLRKGGILYINVPACNIPHMTPIHFSTGFTPMGLATTIAMAGFELMEVGQWGSLAYTLKLFSENRWPDYEDINRNGHNDINCPVITWAFARKP